jgi:energy-coupling factor transport system substrate-specific component
LAVSVFVLTLVNFTGDIWNITNANGDQISMQYLFSTNLPLLAAMIVVGAVAGFFLIKNGGYIGIAGIVTGIVAAAISAPISVYTTGGFNGSGTDILVGAFQAAGTSIYTAVLAQGIVSDPFDKLASFMMVWAVINLLPQRIRDRFSAE